MPFTDEGLAFHAIVTTVDGMRATRETNDRHALLSWLEHHYHPGAGDTLVVGVEASGPAVQNMLSALRLGAAKLHIEQE